MAATAVTPSSFPLLNAIFVRPSLLEAQVPAAALSEVLPARDAEELKELKGRKAEKFAKRWAPLVVHNLFQGAVIEDPGLVAALEKAEGQLKTVAGSAWAAAFREAGEVGAAPSVVVSRMPTDAKKRLHAEMKAWREAAQRIETELARWIVSAADKIQASYAGMQETDSAVSLKKLAKFTPRAA